MSSETPEKETVSPSASEDEPASADHAPDESASETAEAAGGSEPVQQSAESSQAAEPVPADESAPAESSTPTESAASALELGSETTQEETPQPKMPSIIRGKVDEHGFAIGTGRRKTSVARVRIKKGTGQFKINGRDLNEFIVLERNRHMVEAPLKATGTYGQVDVWVRVSGGGTTGQAGAIVLGIARALQAMDPTLHETLSEGGYLTRDSRMVERKKYGLRKARRAFQFSKR